MTKDDLIGMAERIEHEARMLDMSSPRKICECCGRETWEVFSAKQAIDALNGAATRLRTAGRLLS